jgi:microcystin-dependent protein
MSEDTPNFGLAAVKKWVLAALATGGIVLGLVALLNAQNIRLASQGAFGNNAPAGSADIKLVGNTIYSSISGNAPVALALVPAHTLTVSATGADYTTVQAAINAASAGDLIRVFPGTYTEQVTVNKAVTLSGTSRELCIITGSLTGGSIVADGTLIIATNTNPTIENLTIANTCSDTTYGAPALTDPAPDPYTASAVFRNILFTSAGKDTIWLGDISTFSFYDCEITGQYDIITITQAGTYYFQNLEAVTTSTSLFWLGGASLAISITVKGMNLTEANATNAYIYNANQQTPVVNLYNCRNKNVDGTNSVLVNTSSTRAITVAVDDVDFSAVGYASATVTHIARVPPGTMLPYAGRTAPLGWLLCDGSAVSRTTYAGLFAILSTDFGSGNGTTTFNLPDTRGRILAGAGTGAGLAGAGIRGNVPAGNATTARLTGDWWGAGGTVTADNLAVQFMTANYLIHP